jgi:hypothetical protein
MFEVCRWIYRLALAGGAVTLVYLIFLSETQSPFKKELDAQVEELILHRLQSKAELTTAEFNSSGTVEVSEVKNFLGIESKSRLTYHGLGKISAGIDLAKLTPDSVLLRDEFICLLLPEAEILDVEIEVLNSPRAHFDKGLLGADSLELLEQAQSEFIRKVHLEAQKSGVLEEASYNAKQWANNFIQPLVPAYDLRVEDNPENCFSTTHTES